MIGRAKAMGAITLVNAIASGKGATISVGLLTHSKVYVNEGRGGWSVFMNGRRTGSFLAVEAVRGAIKICGKDPGRYSGSVETTTSTPVGVGLKTSSSSSVAIILATLSALGKSTYESSEVARCSASSALAAGVSVTGAMDDAASCLLGGTNFTDNSKMRIVSSSPLGRKLPVIIKVPMEKSRRTSVDVGQVRKFSKLAQSIFALGRQGKIWKAMTLNGLLYCSIYGYPTFDALQAVEGGALGAGLSGTGPAVAAVFENRREAERLARVWEEGHSKVIRTETSDGGATIGI
jgi:shikimate kinase